MMPGVQPPVKGGTMQPNKAVALGSIMAIGVGVVGEAVRDCVMPTCRRDPHVHESVPVGDRSADLGIGSHLIIDEAWINSRLASVGSIDARLGPWVATFGVNLVDLAEDQPERLDSVGDRVAWYDSLENELYKWLRAIGVSRPINTEASERNGETISVRIAMEGWDLDRIAGVDASPWEVLEVAQFAQIYESSWASLAPSIKL